MFDERVTGGWKIIHGENRFIPLGIRRLNRHCKSCAYFSLTGVCQLYGTFISGDSEACGRYISKNAGKIQVNWHG